MGMLVLRCVFVYVGVCWYVYVYLCVAGCSCVFDYLSPLLVYMCVGDWVCVCDSVCVATCLPCWCKCVLVFGCV